MVSKELQKQANGFVRHYTYDSGEVYAFDFGSGTTNIDVEIVDGTAIIVYEDAQYDLDLPSGDVETNTDSNNGVVTIEITY